MDRNQRSRRQKIRERLLFASSKRSMGSRMGWKNRAPRQQPPKNPRRAASAPPSRSTRKAGYDPAAPKRQRRVT